MFKTGDKAFSAKIDSVPNKPVREAHPDLMDQLNSLMLRIEDARQKRLSLLAAERAAALSAFASRFVRLYEQQNSSAAGSILTTSS